MNKTELIAAIASKTELSKKDAEKALKAFTDVVTEELKPHRDEAKRNRDEVGIVANAFRSEDFCVGVLRFFVKGEIELCA